MECATFKDTPVRWGCFEIYIFHLLQDNYVYMFPVPTLNGMVPPFHPKNIPFAYYLHHFRATTPQPSTCILFAAFESHILHTYELHAVHVVTYCIYMLLFYLVYLCANHSVSIYLLFINCR